jgi:hypothetical protein
MSQEGLKVGTPEAGGAARLGAQGDGGPAFPCAPTSYPLRARVLPDAGAYPENGLGHGSEIWVRRPGDGRFGFVALGQRDRVEFFFPYEDLEILGEGEPSAEAAPAYPIRALVRADGPESAWNMDGLMNKHRGQAIFLRQHPASQRLWRGPVGENGGEGWTWSEDDLILNPTPEQIAEERAKLALPSPAAQAAPEPSLGEGNTRVTVAELVKALHTYGGHSKGKTLCEALKHSEYPCNCGFDSLMARIEGIC